MKKIRSYSELRKLETFEDRFEYLKIPGNIGFETFGFDRYLNQRFYTSKEWKWARDEIIIRDEGCDLGIFGLEIHGGIRIHHMNPINVEDVKNWDPDMFNPEYLICCSLITHNLIHYGSEPQQSLPIDRKPNDTCPWKH